MWFEEKRETGTCPQRDINDVHVMKSCDDQLTSVQLKFNSAVLGS